MTKELLTISDLENFKRAELVKFLKGWDIIHEIREWAVELPIKGIFWRCDLQWNKPRRGRIFHPSAISHKCDFKLYLDLIGAKSRPKHGSHLQCIFDLGTAVHEMMQYYLASHAMYHDWEYMDEVAFEPENSSEAKRLKVCGSADGLATRVVTVGPKRLKMKIVFEFKTISKAGFEKLGSKPQTPHIQQTHMYMRCLDAPVTVVIYINKNDSNMVAFPYLFDVRTWKPLEERLVRIAEMADNLEDPIKAVGYDCMECGYLEDCNPPLKQPKERGAPLIGAPEL